MKRIIIGRGNDCDIVIPDDTDDVSRHHLVLSFNFWGKMKASDTSSNGTFINNNRMLKGTSVPVTKRDNLRLGNNWQFDWSLVNDPYRNMRRIIMIVICFILLAGVGCGIWYYVREKNNTSDDILVIPKEEDAQDSAEWNSDSTKKVAPSIESITPQKDLKPKVRRKKSKKNRVNNNKIQSIPKDKVMDKDIQGKDMPLVIN